MIEELLLKLSEIQKIIRSENNNFDLFMVKDNINHKSITEFNNLDRIKNTLNILKYRNNEVFSVIFIGHFSAGKSSSINSLLQLWNTNSERNVGGEVVDQGISILTSPKNPLNQEIVKNNIGIPIFIEPIESDYLNETIYIDTPGSGAFSNDEKNLEDYLFWSDLIIFCTDSTTIFGDLDEKVLNVKQKFLPDLPLIFAFTKINSLFKSIYQESDNINENKVGTFREDEANEKIKKALEILYKQVPGSNYNVNDFVPILAYNNLEYGIDSLREKIEEYKNKRDNQNIAELILKKVGTLNTRINNIKETFIQYGVNQQEKLKYQIEQLKRNRDFFNNVANFELEKLSLILIDQKAKITKAHNKYLTNISIESYERKKIDFENEINLIINKHQTSFLLELESLNSTLKIATQNLFIDNSKSSEEDFLNLIENKLVEFCKKEDAVVIEKLTKEIAKEYKNSISIINTILSPNNKYLPIILKETNEEIEEHFSNIYCDFKDKLETFIEVVAVIGKLEIFQNNAMFDDIQRIINDVQKNNLEELDISNSLPNIDTISNFTNELSSKYKESLNKELNSLLKNQPSNKSLTKKIKFFVNGDDNLPLGYDRSKIKKEFLLKKENLNNEYISESNFKKLNKFSKFSIFFLLVIFCIFIYNFGITYFTTSSGIIDSIVANKLFGWISTLLLPFSAAKFWIKNQLSKISQNNKEKLEMFHKEIVNDVVPECINNIRNEQLKSKQYKKDDFIKEEQLQDIKNSLIDLNTIQKNIVNSFNETKINLDNEKIKIDKKLSEEQWAETLNNYATRIKNEKIEELYSKFNTILDEVNSVIKRLKEVN